MFMCAWFSLDCSIQTRNETRTYTIRAFAMRYNVWFKKEKCATISQARLAQSVERWTFNPTVKGSSPLSGVIFSSDF